ncbi:MAG: TPM domain-containing protein [Bacteroidetes bacterium]|nr:TPM domain-containing protein [Bacteroidota bacterium]
MNKSVQFRNSFFKWICITYSFFLIPFLSLADDFPAKPSTLVSDFTATLSEGERSSLEQKLVTFNDSTSTQIAIVIMRSVGNYDIADYSVQLFNKWKIGQEKKNNGVLILVAKDDRKMWITTGYGIEGVLPDALCKRIVNNDIRPNFKAGNFYEGLDAATNSIMSIVKGEFTADDYMKRNSKEDNAPWFFLVLFGLIFFIVFVSKISKTKNYARQNNLGFWAAWALLNAASARSRGSWGGFSSGGGSWGGSGGGFGGFGGGGSGGGGAGGGW